VDAYVDPQPQTITTEDIIVGNEVEHIKDIYYNAIQNWKEGDYLEAIGETLADAMEVVKNLKEKDGKGKRDFVVAGIKAAVDEAQQQGYMRWLKKDQKAMLFATLPVLINLAHAPAVG